MDAWKVKINALDIACKVGYVLSLLEKRRLTREEREKAINALKEIMRNAKEIGDETNIQL